MSTTFGQKSALNICHCGRRMYTVLCCLKARYCVKYQHCSLQSLKLSLYTIALIGIPYLGKDDLLLFPGIHSGTPLIPTIILEPI